MATDSSANSQSSALLSLAVSPPTTSSSLSSSSSSSSCTDSSSTFLEHLRQALQQRRDTAQRPSIPRPQQLSLNQLNSLKDIQQQQVDIKSIPDSSSESSFAVPTNPFAAFINRSTAFSPSLSPSSSSSANSLSVNFPVNSLHSLANSPIPSLLSTSNTTSACSSPFPVPATPIQIQSQASAITPLPATAAPSSLIVSANANSASPFTSPNTSANISNCGQLIPLADSLRIALQHWLTSTQSFSPFSCGGSANLNGNSSGNNNGFLFSQSPLKVSEPVKALLTNLLPRDSPLVEELQKHSEPNTNSSAAVRADDNSSMTENEQEVAKHEFNLNRNFDDDQITNVYGLHERCVQFRANENHNSSRAQHSPILCSALTAAPPPASSSSALSPLLYSPQKPDKERVHNMELNAALSMNCPPSLSAAMMAATAPTSMSRSVSAPSLACHNIGSAATAALGAAAFSVSACASACASACTSPRFQASTASSSSSSSLSCCSSDSSTAASVPSLNVALPLIRYCVSRSRSGRPPRIRKRRFNFELSDREKWFCPAKCGKYYKRTSSTSITKHLQECAPQFLTANKRIKVQNPSTNSAMQSSEQAAADVNSTATNMLQEQQSSAEDEQFSSDGDVDEKDEDDEETIMDNALALQSAQLDPMLNVSDELLKSSKNSAFGYFLLPEEPLSMAFSAQTKHLHS